MDRSKLGYELSHCRHGTFLLNKNDRVVCRSLLQYGEYSEAEIVLLSRLLHPRDVVVEAGAHIGADTLPLAQRIGPAGKLYAFEPQRLLHQVLCANLAMNGITNVYAPWAALGAKLGLAMVPTLDYTTPHNFGAVSLIGGGDGDLVPVTAIDRLDLPSCSLIKIDVEGMELDVIRGAYKTISKFNPVLYVENNGFGGSFALIQHLIVLGYRLFWHWPLMVTTYNYRNNPINQFEGVVSYNMICVPNGWKALPDVLALPAVSGPSDNTSLKHRELVDRKRADQGMPAL